MYNCQEITHVDLFTEQLVRKPILKRELETLITREKKITQAPQTGQEAPLMR